jgi:WD repeat-containing protein 23
MSAAWDSMRGGTAIARHEWKGLSKMLYKLEDWVEKQEREAEETSIGKSHPGRRQSERLAQQRHARQHVPGSFMMDDDDDDEYESE